MAYVPIKTTATDKDSPGSATLFDRMRTNQDAAFEAIVGTGLRTCTLSTAPANNTTGIVTVASMTSGAYVGLMLYVDDEDSAAFGKSWKIATNTTTSVRIADASPRTTNLYTQGLRNGDTFTIRYCVQNTAGTTVYAHNHDGDNSSQVVTPSVAWLCLIGL